MKFIRIWPRSQITNYLVSLLFLCSVSAVQAAQTNSAVILLYHHVSDTTPKSTSVSPATFETHMRYVAEHYTVLPLSEIIAAIKSNTPLPDKAMAITFDDGYANILTNGHPILAQYQLPYTVFINPDEIGKQRNQLTWQQIKQMTNEGVEFANHTLDHLHMLERLPGENEQDWLARIWKNVEDAESQIAEKTGQSLKFLAYPFGEYNQALAQKVSEEGYIGFGQHSGAVSQYSNLAALPRFPAAGPYANMKSLKVKMASLSMPVVSTTLTNPERASSSLTAAQSITLDGDDVGLSQAACYFLGEKMPVKTDAKTLTYTLTAQLPTGRSRVNCTAPSHSQPGRYYWFSQPFFVAREDGSYPD
ncbi:polysaccharide deacetylase family protein [Alteromonas sp. C1M14]|uniref:polysaccharide deacetylase family protein n=1 Tax=Alteromonas sp. C1M14 TaxID=2841567 RepID=UPI001C08C718|nr:polysaccharide deacetylase family protein [Alteromonas sp. C1M14]MBU2978367.1 polysaccharide deacetylase family protein [Alteromonas sp. C1M14]